MRSLIKGIIGMVIGCAIFIGVMSSAGSLDHIPTAIAGGCIYGFGFTFGLKYVKSAYSWACDAFSGFSWMWKLILVPTVACLGAIPGIFRGIKCIIDDFRGV